MGEEGRRCRCAACPIPDDPHGRPAPSLICPVTPVLRIHHQSPTGAREPQPSRRCGETQPGCCRSLGETPAVQSQLVVLVRRSSWVRRSNEKRRTSPRKEQSHAQACPRPSSAEGAGRETGSHVGTTPSCARGLDVSCPDGDRALGRPDAQGHRCGTGWPSEHGASPPGALPCSRDRGTGDASRSWPHATRDGTRAHADGPRRSQIGSVASGCAHPGRH